MNERIQYSQCPACLHTDISFVLSCKDFTVSKEVFEVWECNNCTLRFTQNAPSENTISPYYQSADYISHSDTKKGLVNRLYHIVRNHTLKTKRKILQKATGLEKGSLLDVGAGTGAFSAKMLQAGWQVQGLEPDATAAQNALKNHGLVLQSLDTLFSLPSNSFDAITMWHVLEHVHQLHAYLDKFFEILKPSGKIFIAVPNYTSYDAKVYGENWAAYDVPRHLYHFSPKSMEALVESKGFRLLDMRPMWFDSFYISLLSEQYKTGKQRLLHAFVNGLVSNFHTIGAAQNCSSVIYIIEKK